MKLLYYIVPIILIFNACEDQQKKIIEKKSNEKDSSQLVVDLNESAALIIELLKKNAINKVLVEDAQKSSDTIDTLIKNFSPAEIAFESEVLNFEKPVVVLFYDNESPEAQHIDNSFEALAYNFYNKAKFVKVDVVKLFKLAEQASIDVAPTLLVIHNRKEIGRLKNPELALLDTELSTILKA